jgi:hypothetical protein
LHDGHRAGVAEQHLNGGGGDGREVERAQLALPGVEAVQVDPFEKAKFRKPVFFTLYYGSRVESPNQAVSSLCVDLLRGPTRGRKMCISHCSASFDLALDDTPTSLAPFACYYLVFWFLYFLRLRGRWMMGKRRERCGEEREKAR